ncbi:M1 family aminopeptidase [Spirosoma daeguense]
MRYLYFLWLLPIFAPAQSLPDGGDYCQAGKIRFFERLAANPKARVAYPGDETIDVTYYGLDLRLTHTPASMRATATVTLKSTAASLRSFFLDLNSNTTTEGLGLRVDSVKTGNQKLTFLHAQNRLTITPAQPLANGQAFTVTVFYQGVPISRDLGSFRFSRHERTTDPVIWSLSEPYGAPDWFPCKDTPGDKADSSSVRITAPAQFVSVSNGTLVSTINNPDGTRTYHWRNSYPIAQYLISVAMSNYTRYDTPFTYGNQTLPITHYVYPEVLPQVRSNLDLTPEMMGIFSERFGPYPFLREKYGHAQIGLGTGGMEHQTVSSMEAGAFSQNVIAHELAHQWFGDKITCRDWQNIWLNEGFASYAEAIYAESIGGQTTYQTTMDNFMSRARNARGSLYVQDISNFTNIFNGNRTYAKGASVLHMLRNVVGDSAFYRSLRTYVATPSVAYNNAVTEDFQAVVQQVAGKDLTYFFKQWIYGEGFPTYQVSYTQGSSATSAIVRLTQRNTIASNPVSFTMPVQLRIRSAVGDTIVTVFNDQTTQTFTVPSRGLITNVVVDPNNWILKNVEASTQLVTAISEPVDVNLRVYPNPTTEQIEIDFKTYTSGTVTYSLTSLLGQNVRTEQDKALPSGKHHRIIRLQSLAAGRYTLTVDTPDGLVSRVVLIQ